VRPEISVLTPSFNQKRYLRDAIASVRHQDFPSVEHIIADGGSTDGTAELLGRTAGVRWQSRPDSGQSQALNRAASLAQGEIIGWLNSDDYYLPDCLRTAHDYFAGHPEVDVLYGDCLYVDELGRLLRARAEHALSWPTLLYWGCYVQSTSSFFRRRLLDTGLLRWDESLRYVMDWELYLRMAAAGVRFSYLPVAFAARRWHGANASLDLAAMGPEVAALQAMYSPTLARSASARMAMHHVFRAWHGVQKAFAGGFAAERRWRTLRGQSTVWWMGAEAETAGAGRD